MNLSEATAIMNSSSGNVSYDIYVPSLSKEVSFKQITTGQQASLAKFSISYSEYDSYEFGVSVLALISSLCLDDSLDVKLLSKADVTCILAAIRLNNILTPLVLNISCPKCENTVAYTVDLDNVIATVTKNVQNNISESIDDIKFILGEPSYIQGLEFNEYINIVIKTGYELSDAEAEDRRLLLLPSIYIKQVFIGDEEVNDFVSETVINKIKFYESLPAATGLSRKDGTALLETIENNFIDVYDNLGECTCNECKLLITDVVTNDSFFIL